MDIAKIESIIQLMKKYEVDQIQVGNTIITKTRHNAPAEVQNTAPVATEEEDLLFYSAE